MATAEALSQLGILDVGDDFKAQHPDYFQLLRDDPRSTGAAIRADYRTWFAQAEQHVRVWRSSSPVRCRTRS
ncbi:zeta toxin family protein [Streptomyces leeuwenhoekii]|uniref:UDP-N-acetylglucosamine kinase n=1 Tax=Streptomyces leeuwenhoekii TaxID=1437453 RepID=A0A0F7VKR2_STRLW|nr:zeta toxin family protein [Streptomyces leeuwenhoekii]CQR59549.1 Hypothetical Protein sle_00870 [Streptomyces leeuwenhoekii]